MVIFVNSPVLYEEIRKTGTKGENYFSLPQFGLKVNKSKYTLLLKHISLTSVVQNPILWFMESEKLAQLVKFISRENVKLKAKLKAQEDEIEALHDLLKQKEKNDRYN